eukprot:GHVR01191331.1.p1 GENE.GHVR01191331.1~~GHVR01191331.1.p1  ORF type:complete len:259 (+),score=60.83 GHVR01191331.1:379-1155(+)
MCTATNNNSMLLKKHPIKVMAIVIMSTDRFIILFLNIYILSYTIKRIYIYIYDMVLLLSVYVSCLVSILCVCVLKIYALLKVPDMGWRLIDEKFEEGKPTLVSCRKAPPVKDDNDTCPFASNVSRVCKDGRTFVCNVGCLGLNTHEMLKRLEKSTDTPAELPVDAFSWEFTGSRRGHAVEVVPPDEKSLLTPLKSALWCVPYELMLSVSDWVKLTYRTQPPDAFFDSNEERERKSAIQKLNENRKKDKQKKPLVFGHH